MQRIAIVDPSEASRESLRTLLLGVDFVWLEAECTRYEYAYDVIQQAMPDLVLVVLDSDHNKALSMIAQVASKYPKMPMLAISNDSKTLLESLQRGVKYFLTQPVGLEDLVSTLRRVVSENGGVVSSGTGPSSVSAQKSVGQIVSVLGARGGVGTTSVAVNLAATLQSEQGGTVGLLDLDLALGDADIAVELPGNENMSISDLARNIERLDMSYLKRAMVRHPESGISILRHPLELSEIGTIHEGHVERILNLLKISYTHLLVDLSKSLLPTDVMSLRMSDVILLVTQLELSSLRNVVRLVHLLSTEGDLGDKIRIVVNRVGSDYLEEGITIKKAEEVIGKPIFWQIANDSKPMMAARVAGLPLAQHGPKSKVQASFSGLAAALTGKTPATPDAKKRGWFGK